MELLADHSLVDQITLVIFFRPDRGRGTRSPFGLAADFRWLDQRLHFVVVGMAADASASIGLVC